MLEIKNVTKIYSGKGKDGASTNALNGVSIKFPEKGLIFLLGKSGSGKSTLLNVCGGLDAPTSGEIIIKGKSSKDFTKSDFDSYRNTFVGFVFQEYNILNEFTVEDNIGLALELQGKKKDKEKINQILSDVDLLNFAKRKPNTLSGGQKQRIAIARALIKEPEIIMADEPTGALDSNTGRQILDTLKKLSKNKLVIVVSHDREFAETYGDRIIELKDGKIISDHTKSHTEPKENGNITKIDDSNILIKAGTKLNKKDLESLNTFLADSDKEIFISKGQNEVSKIKKVTGILDSGAKESFIDTDENKYQKIDYKKEDSDFIKSKLPVRHAFKMGASNLKIKPVRLFFTEILIIASLVLLGLFSTMMFYNKKDVAVSSLSTNNPYITLRKGYETRIKHMGYSFNETQSTKLSDSDVEKYENEFDEVIPYYNFSVSSASNFSIHNLDITNSLQNKSFYYYSGFSGFAYAKDGSSFRDYIIAGTYPTKSNEIMISKYTYDCLVNNKLKNEDGSFISFASPAEIINHEIQIGYSNKKFTITGVYSIDNLIPEKYDELKTASETSMLSYTWEQDVSNSLAAIGLVSKDFYKDNYNDLLNGSSEVVREGVEANPIKIEANNSKRTNLYNSTYVDEFKNHKLYKFSGEQADLLDDDTIYLSYTQGPNFLYNLIYSTEDLGNDVLSTKIEGKDYTVNEARSRFEQGIIVEKIPSGMGDGSFDYRDIRLTEDERLGYLKEIYPYLKNAHIFDCLNDVFLTQDNSSQETKRFKIGGFTFSDATYDFPLIMSKKNVDLYKDENAPIAPTIETKYEIDKSAKVDGIFIKNSKNSAKLNSLVENHYKINDDDSRYLISNSIMSTLDMANTMIENFSQVFLYVGIGLAAFASLLLFNFISLSITNKQKEIGILRAVGARGIDVFKIFFSESFIITLLAAIISLVLGSVFTGLINNALAPGLDGMMLLVFNIKPILLIVVLSILVMFISTFLPVYFIAKKRPVESIRAL